MYPTNTPDLLRRRILEDTQSPCSPFDPCGEHCIWFEYTDVDILDVDDDANVDECYIIDYNERRIFIGTLNCKQMLDERRVTVSERSGEDD